MTTINEYLDERIKWAKYRRKKEDDKSDFLWGYQKALIDTRMFMQSKEYTQKETREA